MSFLENAVENPLVCILKTWQSRVSILRAPIQTPIKYQCLWYHHIQARIHSRFLATLAQRLNSHYSFVVQLSLPRSYPLAVKLSSI